MLLNQEIAMKKKYIAPIMRYGNIQSESPLQVTSLNVYGDDQVYNEYDVLSRENNSFQVEHRSVWED